MGIQRPPLPRCPQCDKTIRAGDMFCRHCGLPLERAQPGATGLRRKAYIAAVIGTAAVSAVVIVHAASAPIASGPTPATRTQSAGMSQPAATISAGTTSSPPTPSTTTMGPWTHHSVTAHGVGFSLQLPPKWTAGANSRPDHWLWTTPNGTSSVTLIVKTHRNPNATQNLGPSAYGTPITTSASGISSQQLDVKWAPRHWLWVTMHVPKSHISELGTIARSVHIS